jgi:hypothetical protein
MCRRVKEELSKGFAEVKRHWLIAIVNLAVWVGGGVFSYIIWIFGGGRETFGPLNSYIFIWLSIVIASTAALNSAVASVIASKALELTRATTRPFLTYLVGGIVLDEGNKVAFLRIVVSNKGNLPAENPFLQILQVTHRSEAGEPTGTQELRNSIPEPSKLRELLKDKKKMPDATFFPDETRQSTITFGPDMLREYQQSKCVAIAVVISYQSMQREYETIRWFLDDKESPEVRFKPIPEKDYFK